MWIRLLKCWDSDLFSQWKDPPEQYCRLIIVTITGFVQQSHNRATLEKAGKGIQEQHRTPGEC